MDRSDTGHHPPLDLFAEFMIFAHTISMRLNLTLWTLRLVGWLSRWPRINRVVCRFVSRFALALLCAALAWPQAATTVNLVQPPPPSVVSAGAAYTGAIGSTPIYYWVIARYPIGASAAPTGPIVALGTVGAENLSGSRYVTITWQPAPGATGYDVIRSTAPSTPIPCTACAVVLNTGSTSATDNGGALSAYPPAGLSTAQTAQATIGINNRDSSQPYAFVQMQGQSPVPLLPGLAPVSSVFGRTGAVSGQSGDYSFSQIGGTLAASQIDSSSKHGNGTKVQMFSGSAPATNDCAKFDADGNIVTAGAACGSGSGSATWGSIGGDINDQTDLQTEFGTKQSTSAKDQANGYAGLTAGTKLNKSQGDEVWGLIDLSDVSGKQGNGTKVQMFGSGTPATDDCAKFDANGNVVSAGAACGTATAVWGAITGTLSDQTDLQSALDAKESLANKNAANGYAGLTASTKLNRAQGQEVWTLSDLSDVSGKQGTGTAVMMFTGTAPAAGDCPGFDASGNLITTGAPCSAGGIQAGPGLKYESGVLQIDPPTVPAKQTFVGNLDFGSISSGACAELTITVSGAAVGDRIAESWPPLLEAGLVGNMRVTGVNTVTVRLCKITSGSVDPLAANFGGDLLRSF